jgi:predicted ATPase
VPADVAHAWLFDQVLAQLSAWCATRPVVLIVDDAHWIDPASHGLLQSIARARGPSRLLLVLAARAEETEPDAADLVELATGPTARHVALGPLTDEAIRALATRAAAGGAAGEAAGVADHLDDVVRRAQGPPLSKGRWWTGRS